MDVILPVVAIVGVLSLGVISPGPSFLFIAQRSLALSRQDGVLSSLGMGLGGVLFACLALGGLHVLLSTFPVVYWGLRVLGGVYLIFLSYKIWKGATLPLVLRSPHPQREPQPLRSLGLGLLTQISNPKTAVVYATVFSGFLPEHFDARFVAALLPAVFVVEAGWYTLVAVLLSSEGPRGVYGRFKKILDRVASTALGLLGIKMMGEGTTDGLKL
jgi:threonine/homoserine/homoserine lactone efflux protein